MNNVEIILNIIKELSQASENALQSGARGDDKNTRLCVDRIRQLRANLQLIDEKQFEDFEAAPIEIKVNVQKHLENVRKSEQFINAWCLRFENIQTIEQLIEIDEGPQIIIDQLVPLVWSWEEDIIIFVYYPSPSIIKALIDRGQKRIVIFSRNEENVNPLVPQCESLTSNESITEYFKKLPKKLPTRWREFEINTHKEVLGGALDAIKIKGLRECFFATWRYQLSSLDSRAGNAITLAKDEFKNFSSIAASATLAKYQLNIIKERMEQIYKLTAKCQKILDKVEKGLLPTSELIVNENTLIDYIKNIDFIRSICEKEISDILAMRTTTSDAHGSLKSSAIFYDLIRESIPIFYPVVRKKLNILG